MSGEIITIDTAAGTVTVKSERREQSWPMASPEAFEAVLFHRHPMEALTHQSK